MDPASVKPPKASSPSIVVIGGVIAFTALACISLTGTRNLVYDEVFYVQQSVTFLQQKGLNTAFLKEFPYPAGLANCVMLRLLEPIVGVKPPQVRVYNLVFLAIVIALCGVLLRVAGIADPWGGGFLTLTNPVVWVLAGLALTEMLAITCTFAALAILWRQERTPRWSPLRAAVGGALFGVAILSRQQLLALIPLFLILPILSPAPKGASSMTIFTAVSAAIYGPVFWVWGGITSPAVGGWNFNYGSLSASNLLLASGYAGAMLLLLAPGWYRAMSRRIWSCVGAAIAVFAVANLLAGAIEISSFRSVADRMLPKELSAYYPRLCGTMLAGLAAIFWLVLGYRSWELRRSAVPLVGTLATAILVLSTIKITHQFSSRYVALAFPFMVLAAAPYRGSPHWQIVRLVLGGCLGVLSLISYLSSG